jgi:DNA-binding NarL/FixJ family response regulator
LLVNDEWIRMRIYILAPYPTVRAGLAALAREQPGWIVVGQGASAIPLAEEAGRDEVDVLLAEVDGSADIETVSEWLDQLRPARGVVALGAVEGAAERAERRGPRAPRGADDALGRAVALARLVTGAGLAFGALPRDAGTEEIIAATVAVASGLTVLDRRLAADALGAIIPPRVASEVAPTSEESLTARESEVLQLLAQGIPNKQIAQRLRISEHTVKFHVSSIMTKLGAASRTEAVTTAARRGLLLL